MLSTESTESTEKISQQRPEIDATFANQSSALTQEDTTIYC